MGTEKLGISVSRTFRGSLPRTVGFSSLVVLPTTIRIDYYYKDGDAGWQLSPCAVSHRKIQNSLVGNSIKEDFRFLIRELPFHSIGSFSQ